MARIPSRIVTAVLVAGVVMMATTNDAEARRRRGRFNPRKARAPLVLTSFVQTKRTDVARNEKLKFRFSAYVRHNSADSRSLRIAAVTSTGLKPAVGAMLVRGSQIFFDPTRSQRNFDASRRRNSTTVDGDNPEGFLSFQDYVVEVPGPPDLHILRNLRGRGIIQSFSGSFRSNGTYLDPVPGQPSFIGNFGTGQLGFTPPRSGSTGLVDEDATVVLEFSEPIDINTLDPSSSVTVERIALSEKVPGFVKKDPNFPSGRRFLFVPSLGFGADELNQRGWDIQVTLSTEVTDLAGNPIKRPIVFPVFRTRFVPGKQSASIIAESFDDQDQMDPSTVNEGGEWNTIDPGKLRGGVATTYPNQDIQYIFNPGLVSTFVGDPLVSEMQIGNSCGARPVGSRVQMLYLPSDVGIAAAITRVSWGPSSNALFAAYHPDIQLSMGHTSLTQLGTDMSQNVNVGTAQQIYRGDYTVIQAANINPPGLNDGFWPWPTLDSPFEFNGANNIIFDAACAPANNCQILRIAFAAGGGILGNRRALVRDVSGDTAEFLEPVVYDIRFQKRRRTTRGMSLWYEVASDDPLFVSPIISPVGQPGGVTVVLRVQAAHGRPDPFNPGGFIADPTTATPWTSDTSEIDGHRFVRFEVEMIANLVTQQTATVSSIQIPYQF